MIRKSDGQADQDVRLFFRIYDDGLGVELDEEFNLDPQLLADLPSLFQKFRFPDGHYKIYLQQVGSDRVRLVLDVHIHEGKVVPENYRDVERSLLVEPVTATTDLNADDGADERQPELAAQPEGPTAGEAAERKETDEGTPSDENASDPGGADE